MANARKIPIAVVFLLTAWLSGGNTAAEVSFYQVLYGAGLSPDDVGIVVGREDGTTVFTHNAGKTFVPASVTKVLTAAAAMEHLGGDYKFRTQLLSTGQREQGAVHGSIYLKGGGDPLFFSNKDLPVLDKFPALLSGLMRQNIDTIEGDIVIDDTRFSEQIVDDMATARSVIRSWNGNGIPLFIKIDPYSDMERGVSRSIYPVKRGSRQTEFVVYQNVIEPDLWTGYDLARCLRARGIKIQGTVKRGKVPAGAQLISEITTPLAVVIREMMKNSNNLYAEMLALNIAAEKGAGNFPDGLNFITSYIEQISGTSNGVHLASAAGYSHTNRMTPASLYGLLTHLKEKYSGPANFESWLPVSGIDGSLKNRFRNSIATGRVSAKTGYLAGVVTLAGYIQPLKGEPLTFVFFYNGPGSAVKVKAAFDKICMQLINMSEPPLLAATGSPEDRTASAAAVPATGDSNARVTYHQTLRNR